MHEQMSSNNQPMEKTWILIILIYLHCAINYLPSSISTPFNNKCFSLHQAGCLYKKTEKQTKKIWNIPSLPRDNSYAKKFAFCVWFNCFSAMIQLCNPVKMLQKVLVFQNFLKEILRPSSVLIRSEIILRVSEKCEFYEFK